MSQPPANSRSDIRPLTRLRVVRGDITAQDDVDAIVGSVTINMEVKGTLNKALIEIAGADLDEFILEQIYKPRLGDAFALPPFNLPVKHLIYIVTPNWRDEFDLEDRHLLRCYRQATELAQRMNLKKIAFPALGTGRNKYPLQRAARLAIKGITDRLDGTLEEVRIVCNREDTYQAFVRRIGQAG